MRVVAAHILVGDPIVLSRIDCMRLSFIGLRPHRGHARSYCAINLCLNLTSLKHYRDLVFIRYPPILR
jgi:hypothetical protein